ncbi:hypothetical protein DSCA_12710 [Desulfosarcina alkanivorans]|uniref:Uncharacterized protein n=1 Tax=Desulfosarcina alkanivorans TaxID=571177 RepID=A0A5K7YKJ8_9BACT|nr:hypothetical protein [Desulfosarcina alkanivorans]BBO67341.1 hypothetical protein DSCA_12710 [Desulfosarcina alkanivorans]
MNNFDEHKWPAVVFFLTCGLFFFGCVWYLWAGALDPDYYWQSSPGATAEFPDRVLEKNGRVIIAKNHGARAGNARIVYRGSHSGTLHMDLFILELDPHYGYPHQIEERQARKGFRLGDDDFQVTAASDGKISLKRL